MLQGIQVILLVRLVALLSNRHSALGLLLLSISLDGGRMRGWLDSLFMGSMSEFDPQMEAALLEARRLLDSMR